MSNETQLEAHLFAVELTYPHRYEIKNQKGETVPMVQNCNEQRHIFCATAERAIELAHDAHADATIHVVRKIGERRPVIIDPDLIAAVRLSSPQYVSNLTEDPSSVSSGDTTT